MESATGPILGFIVTLKAEDGAEVIKRSTGLWVNVFPNEKMMPQIIDESIWQAIK